MPPGRELGDAHIAVGDAVIASGPLGDHGAAIMASRHGLTGPVSDCASVTDLCEALFAAEVGVRALHDPTRGGAIATCHEVSERSAFRIRLEESQIPVRPEVGVVCELLGLDPLWLASEGRVLAWVPAAEAARAVDALRSLPSGRRAAQIGEVLPASPGGSPVVLRTRHGRDRPLDLRAGLDLPRIC